MSIVSMVYFRCCHMVLQCCEIVLYFCIFVFVNNFVLWCPGRGTAGELTPDTAAVHIVSDSETSTVSPVGHGAPS